MNKKEKTKNELVDILMQTIKIKCPLCKNKSFIYRLTLTQHLKKQHFYDQIESYLVEHSDKVVKLLDTKAFVVKKADKVNHFDRRG